MPSSDKNWPLSSGVVTLDNSNLMNKLVSLSVRLNVLYLLLSINSALLFDVWPQIEGEPARGIVLFMASGCIVMQLLLRFVSSACFLTILPAILGNLTDALMQRSGLVVRRKSARLQEPAAPENNWRAMLWKVSHSDRRRVSWAQHKGLDTHYNAAFDLWTDAENTIDAVMLNHIGLYGLMAISLLSFLLITFAWVGAKKHAITLNSAVISVTATITTSYCSFFFFVLGHLLTAQKSVRISRRIMLEVNGGISFASSDNIMEAYFGGRWMLRIFLHGLCMYGLLKKFTSRTDSFVLRFYPKEKSVQELFEKGQHVPGLKKEECFLDTRLWPSTEKDWIIVESEESKGPAAVGVSRVPVIPTDNRPGIGPTGDEALVDLNN